MRKSAVFSTSIALFVLFTGSFWAETPETAAPEAAKAGEAASDEGPAPWRIRLVLPDGSRRIGHGPLEIKGDRVSFRREDGGRDSVALASLAAIDLLSEYRHDEIVAIDEGRYSPNMHGRPSENAMDGPKDKNGNGEMYWRERVKPIEFEQADVELSFEQGFAALAMMRQRHGGYQPPTDDPAEKERREKLAQQVESLRARIDGSLEKWIELEGQRAVLAKEAEEAGADPMWLR